MLKVFLVDIVSKNIDRSLLEDRMRELENLVETFGGMVIVKTYQKRQHPDYRTYIGRWKLEEIKEEMQKEGASLLIIGNILRPSQVYMLNEKMRDAKIEVWDRVDLILKIFDKHADSTEAKLQIELAAIRHMGPRIFGMGMELSRQGGGIGTKGIGETNTEIMKRHLKERVYKVQQKLEEYAKMRKLHRESRSRKSLPVVGIVGYTNAGKSSLLNLCTKKNVLAANKLFATLWTNVGNWYIITDPVMGTGKEILLSDTIWFIRDLPPKLIQAFRSTLEDSIESDLLLHVIDASDPFVDERIQVVEDILREIGVQQPILRVFNKIELLSPDQRAKLHHQYNADNVVRISVYNNQWIDMLQEKIVKFLS